MSWSAVLLGAEAARAEDFALRIAQDLYDARSGRWLELVFDDSTPPLLAEGRAGVALLFGYLYRLTAGEPYRSIAERLVFSLLEDGPSPAYPLSLYCGSTGVAWAICHLHRLGLFDESVLPDEDFDAGLLDWLAQQPSDSTMFDVVYGIVGIGVYALALPLQRSTAILREVIRVLNDRAVRDSVGCHWPFAAGSGVNPKLRTMRHSLGLAHGHAGVAAFLAQVNDLGLGDATTANLLNESAEWLLAQKPDSKGCEYPTERRPNCAAVIVPVRWSWCWGEAATAHALLLAASSAANERWRAVAVEWAEREAAGSLEAVNLEDACLCHGTAGAGHVFARLFNTTGLDTFRVAAQAWFRRTLEHPTRDGRELLGGYRFLDNSGGFGSATGVLRGAAGVALGLLASASSLDPSWDRMLLLS